MTLKRTILSIAFGSLAILCMPSLFEALIVLLFCIFVFAVFKDRVIPSISDNNINAYIKKVIRLAPLFLIFFVYMAIYDGRLSAMLILFIGAVLLFLGSYFIYSLALNKGKENEETFDTAIPIAAAIFYLIFAFTVMLFLSQSSPLYPMNLWDDTNIYHTVSRAILRGKVLYRDIHDQKGPLMYLINIPFLAISEYSFTGMYIIESLYFFIFILFSAKISSLFLKHDFVTYLLIPVFCLACYSSQSFYFGGSAEELTLPFSVIILYVGLKAVKEKRMFTIKEAFLTGVLSCVVFWTKFTLCGFYLGFLIFVVIYAIRNKVAKDILKLAASYIAGFICVTVPVFLFFLIKGTPADLINGYFISNLVVYPDLMMPDYSQNVPIVNYLLQQVNIFFSYMQFEHVLYVFIFSAFVYLIVKKDKRTVLLFLLTLFFASLGIVAPGYILPYYLIGLKEFVPLGFIPLLLLVQNAMKIIKNNNLRKAVASYAVISIAAYYILTCQSVFLLGKSRDQYPQFRFAQIISQYDNPKIINYGTLDTGIYFASHTLPFNVHYCMNSDFEYYTYEQKASVAAGEADFIITRNKTYEWDNYELIAQETMPQINFDDEIDYTTYYLYQRIG